MQQSEKMKKSHGKDSSKEIKATTTTGQACRRVCDSHSLNHAWHCSTETQTLTQTQAANINQLSVQAPDET